MASDESAVDAAPLKSVRKKPGARQERRWLSPSELMDMEDPQEIIEGIMFEGAIGLLYGERNVGKTFLSLDMAMRVALGLPWFGRKTRQGVVFYIYAEAPPHLKKRVQTFVQEHGLNVEDLDGKIYFFPGAVNFMEPGKVEALIADLKKFRERPALIFIDTLAKNTVGADDANNEAMGRFVDNLAKIRDAFPYSSQVVIHHPGHSDKGRPRGAYNLQGGTDFEILVKGKTHPAIRTVECKRQHEGPCFVSMKYTTKVVGPSLVVEPILGGDEPEREEPSQLLVNVQTALGVLVSNASASGLSWKDWKSLCATAGLTKSQFGKARDALLKDHRVRQEGTLYFPVEVQKAA